MESVIDNVSSMKNNLLPSGAIILWSGTINGIPVGFALCDGTNGTPNLKGKFIVGYDPGDRDYEEIGLDGGDKKVTLKENQMPSHNHGGTIESSGNHNHDGATVPAGGHTHSYNLATTDDDGYREDDGNIYTSKDGAHDHVSGKKLIKDSGGNRPIYLGDSSYGKHRHKIPPINSVNDHTHGINIVENGDHTHTLSINNTGGGLAHENRPPYYTLAYIMKL